MERPDRHRAAGGARFGFHFRFVHAQRACGEFALLWDPVSDEKKMLVECDLESQNASVIGVPETHTPWRHFVLDGGLGFATVREFKLCIWRKAGSGCGWAQHGVIELDTSVCFLSTSALLVMIDLETKKGEEGLRG
jgi:hypothetical protein